MKNKRYLETNLLKIRYFSEEREDENFRFRKFLKNKDREKVDKIVHRLHAQITRQIDCASCGNCCRCLTAKVTEDEIAILAQLKNISPEDYQTAYCEEEFGKIYFKNLPCQHLDGEKCGVYENRPEECKQFPYTAKDGFISRLYGMIEFYAICPIVFNLMEQLKYEMHFFRPYHR